MMLKLTDANLEQGVFICHSHLICFSSNNRIEQCLINKRVNSTHKIEIWKMKKVEAADAPSVLIFHSCVIFFHVFLDSFCIFCAVFCIWHFLHIFCVLIFQCYSLSFFYLWQNIKSWYAKWFFFRIHNWQKYNFLDK